MGNCQAVDAATLVIQHPGGKIERMYWPVTASEVMKVNPGHYVSLIIPLPNSGEESNKKNNNNKINYCSDQKTNVRFTRVKLLRPGDALVPGRAYRLLTSQEVMKVLRAKRISKMKIKQQESNENSEINIQKGRSSNDKVAEESELKKTNQAMTSDRYHQKPVSKNVVPNKSRSWCPSLQSISEGGS